MPDGCLVLIDGHYYAYRFHFGGPALSGPDGRPTGVTFAFADLFARLRRDPAISHIAAVFDHSGPCFRHHLFPAYKAHRDPMPPDLKRQLPDVAAIADAMGIPRLEIEGYEADDVIATLAHEAEAAGLEARICTRDKDLDQTITQRIRSWDPLSGQLRGPEQVRAERGVDCDQIVDYLVMVGDAADNVPGIRGIGAKTAASLLQRYGSLHRVFDHLDDLRGKRREHVEAFREHEPLTRELIAIVEVPDLPPLERLAKPTHLPPDATAVLAGFGFATARFDDAPALPDAAAGLQVHALTGTAVVACCDRLRLARHAVALAPLRGGDGGLRAIAVATDGDGDEAWVLRLDHSEAQVAVRDLLADPALPVVAAAAATTLAGLARDGFPVANLTGDPVLAAWLLDPDHPHTTVAGLVRAHLGEALAGERDAPTAASVEARCLLRLHRALDARLGPVDLARHYHEIELPCSAALAAATTRGIALDRTALAERREHLEGYLAQVVTELRVLAGPRFNPASPSQVAALLFDRLALPAPRRTRGGPCVDDQVLACLRGQHEAADLLLQYRQLARLLGDDLLRFDAAIDPVTGRIHPAWCPRGEHGALHRDACCPTRLPGSGELGRELRAALQSEPDCELVAVRLPYLQLHLLAGFAADHELRDALRADDDPHRAIAARLFRTQSDGIGPGERRVARELMRALVDGASAFALSQRLGVPRAEAASLLAEHVNLFPATAAWLERTAEEAGLRGFARSLHGRRRRLAPSANATDALRNRRSAIAWTLTASTWDLLKHALVAVAPTFDHPVIPLDDGLAASSPASAAESAAAVLRDALLAPWPTADLPSPRIHRGPSLLAVG